MIQLLRGHCLWSRCHVTRKPIRLLDRISLISCISRSSSTIKQDAASSEEAGGAQKNHEAQQNKNANIISMSEGKARALSSIMNEFSSHLKLAPGKLAAAAAAEAAVRARREAERAARREAAFAEMGSYTKLLRQQEEWEQRCTEEAMQRYMSKLEELMEAGRGAGLKPVQRHMLKWYGPLVRALGDEQRLVWQGAPGPDRNVYGPYLVLLAPAKIAVLVLHEVVNSVLKDGNTGSTLTHTIFRISEAFQAEVNILKMKGLVNKDFLDMVTKSASGGAAVRKVNQRARAVLDDPAWPPAVSAKLGGLLVQKLITTAGVGDVSPPAAALGREAEVEAALLGEAGEGGAGSAAAGAAAAGEAFRPAFLHQILSGAEAYEGDVGTARRRGVLRMDKGLYDEVMRDAIAHPLPRFLPMLVPPRPWERHDRGGYVKLRMRVMRTKGNRAHIDALRQHQPREVYRALDCLGSTAWRINRQVYQVARRAWEEDLAIADLPRRRDHRIPPPPPGVEDDPMALQKYRFMANKLKKKNNELHSLRCDKIIKLNIADMFLDHTFYFPFSLDFRGRAYPVPPNLNNMGEDLCKGLLRFDRPRPLGDRGLRWLKVHLANLFGMNKISNEERVQFVDDNIDNLIDSADNPLNGKRWWAGAEDGPFQALAAIFELRAALRLRDPRGHLSALPVQQDGSCNGLQHYAALGRDYGGGKQVNLVPQDKPGDVYAGVCEKVIEKVEALVAEDLPGDAPEGRVRAQRLARLLRGKVSRKVIKQTVMTSVYGVTPYGARLQIANQLEDIFTDFGKKVLTAEEEQDITRASQFLATLTMECIGEVFKEARRIMDWLADCAALVAGTGCGAPVAWVTPLGLPVVQPYRKNTRYVVQTLVQYLQLARSDDALPVAAQRQRSAFPPNFVHSLDSTHMMMTAVKMHEAGLDFAAVHDSYWTHAADVDTMNRLLRESFVELYQQPVLERLYDSLRKRHPGLAFPPVPPRGALDLASVLDSPYFFA